MTNTDRIPADEPPRLRAVLIDGPGAPSTSDNRWMACTTTNGCWIIDLANSRLCRTDGDRDPRFVAPEHWHDFEAVWVGADQIRAEMCDGIILSAHRAA